MTESLNEPWWLRLLSGAPPPIYAAVLVVVLGFDDTILVFAALTAACGIAWTEILDGALHLAGSPHASADPPAVRARALLALAWAVSLVWLLEAYPHDQVTVLSAWIGAIAVYVGVRKLRAAARKKL